MAQWVKRWHASLAVPGSVSAKGGNRSNHRPYFIKYDTFIPYGGSVS